MNLYDNEYLNNTLYMLNAELRDMETWSAYNNDKYNEEIGKIRELIQKITIKESEAI